jgi:ABC-type uncharacterized transport system permease subunit
MNVASENVSQNLLFAAAGWLLVGALVCYGVATVLLWAHLLARGEPARAGARSWQQVAEIASFALLFVGLNLHALSLLGVGRAILSEKAGVAGLFGCVLVAAYLGWRHRVGQPTLGAFISPLAFGLALLSLATPTLQSRGALPPLRGLRDSLWRRRNRLAGGARAADSVRLRRAFVCLCVQHHLSGQDGLLKRKKLASGGASFGAGLWQRLPPLGLADQVIERATQLGLLLLSLGLATGAVWSARGPSPHEFWRDPKVLFSLAVWAVFAAYVGARAWLGWRGRRTNLVVVFGFLLAVLSFIGAPHAVPGR